MVREMPKRSVDDVCHDIRQLANIPLFVQNIKRHGFNWNLTWAAMDTIEDTELAINSFNQKGTRTDQGEDYLKVYGLFQAIFMQQDAVQNFAEGFNLPKIDISTDTDASEVREIRNKYFGHPKYTRKGVTTYHGISRITVGGNSITAWTWPKFSTESINLKDAIDTNQKYIKKSLEEILGSMKDKKSDYAATVKTKMSEDRQSYAFEKIFSWIYGSTPDRSVMTEAGLKIIKSAIQEIEKGLNARYETLSGIGDSERTIKKARYALDALNKLFVKNPDGMNGDFNAEIYADSLQSSFDELISVCEEVNTEFNS